MADEVQPGTHRAPSRGQFRGEDTASVPESSLVAGRFGRMFRNLPSYEPDDEWLETLAGTMLEGGDTGDGALPAGITYFGQFVDHDLTFDPVSSLDRQNDPDALQNFRTPRFDLDCVYGRGPDDQPYLYEKDDPAKLFVAEGEAFKPPDTAEPQPTLNDPEHGMRREHDLPRNAHEKALIGDPRNDENIIISQLQLAFLKLHNRIVDDIRDPDGMLRPHLWSDGDPFREAQRLTRWHYQWLVLKAFLPAICDPAVIAELVEETPVDGGRTCRRVRQRNYYLPKSNSPYIPVEWSVAAYRFGHSLIRPSYHLNETLRGFRQGAPIDIFIENPTPETRLQHLAGGRLLPPFWTIDWRMFFDFGEGELQHVRRIDTKLASGLSHLPGAEGGMRALARRNLLRGRAMGLPSGDAVARRICAPLVPPAEELGGAEAPLWFYVLREADAHADGARLGSVGSTIVAETMLGMLAGDPFSFLRTDPTWEPVLPPRVEGTARSHWEFDDMLAYAVPADGRHLQPPGGPEPPPPPAPGGW